MVLLYINELGKDYRGQRQYEFLFGKEIIEEIEDEWFIVPSSGRSVTPKLESIDLVGLLKNSHLKLGLIQDSDYFGVIDAVDGIISLGWEPYDMDATERQTRLSFQYGESLDSVLDKLKTKGLRLINEEIKFKLR